MSSWKWWGKCTKWKSYCHNRTA